MELTWLSYCLTFKYMVHGRAKKCKKAPQILVISQYEAYMPLHVPGTKCCCQTYTRFKCACLLWAFQVGWINNQEILWMKRLLYNGVCVCVCVCVWIMGVMSVCLFWFYSCSIPEIIKKLVGPFYFLLLYKT